jgi:CDP-diacylglycerol--serine O-phosphatidyltransferase
MTRRTSEFGAQLDSIADIVSFGAAPALLFVTLLLRPAIDAAAEEPDVSKLQARFGMASALVYVSCAAIRLARYNAENVKTEAAQRAFSGLPSPGAAAAIVALLALHEHVRHKGLALGSVDWPDVARWVIAGTAFIVGLLMVSRLDYVHIFNVYVRRKHPPTHLVWLIALLGLIGVLGVWRYSLELLMVVVALAYVASGPVVYLMNRRRRAAVTLQAEPLPKPALRAEDL